MSLLEVFWQLNKSTGNFLATKLVYGKLSGLSRADPQSSSSSGEGGRTTTTLALFPPNSFVYLLIHSYIFLPHFFFSPPFHSYIFRFIRISSFLNFFSPPIYSYMFQFIPISSFFKFFLPQFIRISSNSFVYLLAFPGPTPKVVVVRRGGRTTTTLALFSPNSFVYLPIHSYIFLPHFFSPPIHSYIFRFIRISSFLNFFSPPIHSYMFQFIPISSFFKFFLPQFILSGH